MNCVKVFSGALIVSCLFVSAGAFGQSDEMATLKDSVGKWKAELKMFDPSGGEAGTSTGTEVNEMIGDNWLISRFEADFQGQPFKGVGLIGYDGDAKKYINHWVDSMGATMANFSGTYDAKTKTMTMTGKDQMGEGKHTTLIKDAKTRVFTMYSKPDGTDDFVKVMEITYTKQ